MAHKPLTIHASLIAIDGAGVLILGDPGAGKSDLALRLIDEGARLVADDRVEPFLAGGRLMGRAPAAIAGLLEARGAGIARLAHLGQCPIRLAVLLVGRGEIDRLPEPKAHVIEGLAHPPIPAVCLVGFDASATARVRLVLGQLKKRPG